MPKEKSILTTSPHGEQVLKVLTSEKYESIDNSLFSLNVVNGRGRIVMTGEELTSLANQWLELVKRHNGKAKDL